MVSIFLLCHATYVTPWSIVALNNDGVWDIALVFSDTAAYVYYFFFATCSPDTRQSVLIKTHVNDVARNKWRYINLGMATLAILLAK